MEYIAETDSTNEYLKRKMQSGDLRDLCCYTFRQTKGKGRNGRTFISDDGGLYFSQALPFGSMNLMLRASLATCRLLESNFHTALQIKWVNDILLNGKKCCGILAEKLGDSVILGIGINIYNRIDESISDTATALSVPEAADYGKLHKLAAALRQAVMECGTNENWLGEYTAKSNCIGRQCILRIPDGAIFAQGIVTGFRENGNIVMQTEDGEEKEFEAGELSLRTK